MVVSNKQLREALGGEADQYTEDQLTELKASLYQLAEIAYDIAVKEETRKTESKYKEVR